MTADRTDDATGRDDLRLLVQLRWIAAIGQITTIAFTHTVLGVALPLGAMAAALAILIAFNLVEHWRSQRRTALRPHDLFGSLLVDVGVLTVQLYLSGGATNPFAFLYLLQVGLGGALLPTRHTWALLGIALAALAGLAVWHHPLPLDFDGTGDALYLTGLWISFALTAVLLVIYLTRISRNLRARDARLADLRQRAAENEHIVRMGLLASGAAHELSTPLATLAVILGDWRRMSLFKDDPELLQEMDDMQTQVARCKAIVHGILQSAGESRGGSLVETTVQDFLDALVRKWRETRPGAVLAYSNAVPGSHRIFADETIEQMICNVLDNALEASPGRIELKALRARDRLEITVADAGPGFPPEILRHLGQPYHSTKQTPGAGLGLFLATNVARRLGGQLTAENRPGRGAVVTITLPFAAISREGGAVT